MNHSAQQSSHPSDRTIYHPAMGSGFTVGRLNTARDAAIETLRETAAQPKPYRNPWADKDGFYVFQSA